MNAPPRYPQQPYPQQPAAPPGPPPKKSGGGCLLALGIVAGIFLLIAFVGAFVAWRFATSPDGKKVVSAVKSGAALVSEGVNAPGTEQLRGLGCGSAFVVDAQRIQAVVDELGDAGHEKMNGDVRLFVSCTADSPASAPTCDQVAATYVAAVGRAAGVFEVQVTAQTRQRCKGIYSPDGAHVTATK